MALPRLEDNGNAHLIKAERCILGHPEEEDKHFSRVPPSIRGWGDAPFRR